MGFSAEWEKTYASGAHRSVWPWSDLVSLFIRHARPGEQKKEIRVLELGFGAGANIPFFNSLGNVIYYGVDGSEVMVSRVREQYPLLSKRLLVQDFTQGLGFDETFDFIIDRASLTHNSTIDIKRCIGFIEKALRPGGKFIGVDWFSLQHSDLSFGVSTADSNTFSNFSDGQFVGVGKVHFSDTAHLRSLFEKFNFTYLEEKIRHVVIPQSERRWAGWDFVVTAKES